LRATERLVFQARKGVWEIVRRHEERAQALVEKHAAQRVQTDETGHYVLVKVPAGKAYVYTRLREKKDDFVWFVPVEIQAGTQHADLTQDNQRRWPFALTGCERTCPSISISLRLLAPFPNRPPLNLFWYNG
jgi:hypothetical protein